MVQIPLVEPASSNQDMRLHYAARFGDVEEVERLLNDGASIDATDARGVTPLIFAAMTGQLETVKLLIKRGADPGIKDDFGYSAYKAAMFYGDFKGVTLPPHDKVLEYLKKFER